MDLLLRLEEKNNNFQMINKYYPSRVAVVD